MLVGGANLGDWVGKPFAQDVAAALNPTDSVSGIASVPVYLKMMLQWLVLARLCMVRDEETVL